MKISEYENLCNSLAALSDYVKNQQCLAYQSLKPAIISITEATNNLQSVYSDNLSKIAETVSYIRQVQTSVVDATAAIRETLDSLNIPALSHSLLDDASAIQDLSRCIDEIRIEDDDTVFIPDSLRPALSDNEKAKSEKFAIGNLIALLTLIVSVLMLIKHDNQQITVIEGDLIVNQYFQLQYGDSNEQLFLATPSNLGTIDPQDE